MTGSYPPGLHGLQRSRRRAASAIPLMAPWFRIASAAYSEQLGSYRHVLGLYLEIFWYNLMKKTKTYRNLFPAPSSVRLGSTLHESGSVKKFPNSFSNIRQVRRAGRRTRNQNCIKPRLSQTSHQRTNRLPKHPPCSVPCHRLT